jgi:hypothetical protein
MATVDQHWQMAHDLYAQARASIDPATKRMLLRRADELLRQAEELQRGHVVQAAFPKPEDRIRLVRS